MRGGRGGIKRKEKIGACFAIGHNVYIVDVVARDVDSEEARANPRPFYLPGAAFVSAGTSLAL
jgi:hypothetical protein